MRDHGIANARVFLNGVGGQSRVNLNWQQVSNENSTITQTNERDSVSGLFKVKTDWQMTKQDFLTASTMLDLVETFLTGINEDWTLSDRFDGKDGGGKGTCVSDEENWFLYQSWGGKGVWAAEHHMGATRMSNDPADGIVDPDCRVHTLDNLFVSGSSVFPQCGFANSTFTIIAMAVRLAEHLKKQAAY